ncbi:MAG TPA: hypothetical protein VGX78_21970 [Pirellulales bacterium]|jgi:hypothetical protein|nr:hypothetical protein [Pirellulales bacterium]
MTVLHTGATKKYVAGWEAVFSRAGSKGKKTADGAKKAAGKKAKAKSRKKAKAGK